MKQDAFEAQFSPRWDRLEQWIATLENRAERDRDPQLWRQIGNEFPSAYREVCHHLALAKARRYSLALQTRLNRLALTGHRQLYRTRTPVLMLIGRFLVHEFPVCFREHWKPIAWSAVLLYLPAFLMAFGIWIDSELLYSLITPGDVAMMEEMYDPENDVLGRERASDTDVMMFGYYIYNNVTIGFQVFAGGLLFGIGSVFYLVFNGLYFGAVGYHLSSIGFAQPFWSFVSGHSSFELTAIVIFGGLGLAMGYRAIAPGRQGRWQAIAEQARNGVPLIYGGTLMLFAAAFVEAFWSSTTWPPSFVKYGVGIAFWLLLGLYFFGMGRGAAR